MKGSDALKRKWGGCLTTLATSKLMPEIERFIGMKYALIDYPNYLNPGDAAIWLGTRKILEELFSAPPAYLSTLKAFNAKQCSKQINDGPVFFLGGGNFGSLYTKHNNRRIDIIKALSANPIIVLPISVADDAESNDDVGSAIRRALLGRQNLTIFARETVTQQTLKKKYGLPSILCPDLAHFLDVNDPKPTKPVLHLRRQDGEKQGSTATGIGCDWGNIVGMKTVNRIGKSSAVLPNGWLRRRAYDYFANWKVELATNKLGSAALVETDRLHGAILAANMGVPVKAYDNSTGKVAAYISTWQAYLENVEIVRS